METPSQEGIFSEFCRHDARFIAVHPATIYNIDRIHKVCDSSLKILLIVSIYNPYIYAYNTWLAEHFEVVCERSENVKTRVAPLSNCRDYRR
jgi:hypothetical protein